MHDIYGNTLHRICHISRWKMLDLAKFISVNHKTTFVPFISLRRCRFNVIIVILFTEHACQAMRDSPASLVAIHEYAVEMLRQRIFGFMPFFRGR